MQRSIASVVRVSTHSNSGWAHPKPLRIVRLCGCVHEAVSDEPVGASIECTSCGDLTTVIQRIREFVASDKFSHVTERSTACNNDPSWSSFFFYRCDPTSPTQCILEFAAPRCDEIARLIGELGTRALPGPTRGQFARL